MDTTFNCPKILTHSGVVDFTTGSYPVAQGFIFRRLASAGASWGFSGFTGLAAGRSDGATVLNPKRAFGTSFTKSQPAGVDTSFGNFSPAGVFLGGGVDDFLPGGGGGGGGADGGDVL